MTPTAVEILPPATRTHDGCCPACRATLDQAAGFVAAVGPILTAAQAALETEGLAGVIRAVMEATRG